MGAIHTELIREHGGVPGPPRDSALESTLARPQQFLNYADSAPSIFKLAATYGFGLAKNHCFPDGNKRLALAVIDVFLQLSGFELTAREEDAVLTIRSLAAGDLSEADLANWIEKNCAPV